ncbi:uncharacterized protein LOC124448459 [Xenia sp. Carnegie-2017]|uniref:uncharacterized protein LOC124448459 n=1 Tax=Xenia sp. Carnegie-2017 TaxID=2897299 RepID=UPI001F038E9A|nr:uncharacterized protein LOC124448459 [Xenia sp. Carnegie-2017]
MAEAQDTDLDIFETLTKEESIGDQIQETYGRGIISENLIHCDTSKISSDNEAFTKNSSCIVSNNKQEDEIRRLELQIIEKNDERRRFELKISKINDERRRFELQVREITM